MCDCCKKHGINSTFMNGNKDLFECRVYEAYGEVSNQLWGAYNQSLIAKIEKNTRLSLVGTARQIHSLTSLLHGL